MYQGRVRLTVSSKCIECVSICIEPLTSAYPPQAYPVRYICIVPVSTTYRCCIETIETSLAVLSEHNDTHSIHVRYELGVLTPQCGGPAYRSRIVSKLYRSCIVRAPELRIDAVSEVGIVFVSSMYRSLITIQYPRCIECVSKWYRKTIQYRSPDGAKNVSCLYRKCIEQKVSRYCIERCIEKITIHVRYTTIHYDTLRYLYREKPPRYRGKSHTHPPIRATPSITLLRQVAFSLRSHMYGTHVRSFQQRGSGPTVSASVLGSFGFGHGAFTPPVRSLLTPAAAHKRLAAAPSGETSPRRAESMVAFVNTMLHGRSAALPGRRESAALGSRFLRERPANHARYLN